MLDPAETITLAVDTAALGQQFAAAISVDGDGGKKVTKKEGAALVKLALAFASHLVRDLVD